MKTFADKTAVVTGAASGIGRAIATRCAAEGMHVVMADIEQAALTAAAEEIGAATGARTLPVVTDVADPGSVEALAEAARTTFGDVHLLVNNAGVGHRARTWDISLTDWQWVMGVCFWGVVHGVKSFVPAMIDHGGDAHVVNTSSWNGLGAASWGAPYNSAKHAVTALTETLFYDLRDVAPQVKVSLLCPGYTATRITQSRRNHPEERAKAAVAATGSPAGRPATASASASRGPKRPPVDWAAPESVAATLFDAIGEGRFYVYADRETWIPILTEHVNAMLAGGDPAPVAIR